MTTGLRTTGPPDGLAAGHLKVWLDGEKLTGGYALTHTKMRGDDRNWLRPVTAGREIVVVREEATR